MMRQVKRADPFYQAQAILSRRDHSIAEVTAKLRRQGFAAGQITAAVTRLIERGLVNDDRFARAYIDAALRRTAVGPRWLQHKLLEKGITPELITAVLKQTFPRGRAEALAHQAAANWQRRHPRQASDQARLARFLASRGFSSEIISSILA